MVFGLSASRVGRHREKRRTRQRRRTTPPGTDLLSWPRPRRALLHQPVREVMICRQDADGLVESRRLTWVFPAVDRAKLIERHQLVALKDGLVGKSESRYVPAPDRVSASRSALQSPRPPTLQPRAISRTGRVASG